MTENKCTLATVGESVFRRSWSLSSVTDEILIPEVAKLLKVAEKTVYTLGPKVQHAALKVTSSWRLRYAKAHYTASGKVLK